MGGVEIMSDISDYNHDLENIISIIERSKAKALKAVNSEMIEKIGRAHV